MRSIADWDSSMLIAQGAANDDPRVYRPNSMYEVPIDLYALYGAYDDDNLYLMWEMTNVQDVVDTGDDYPLSQGHLGRPRTCRSTSPSTPRMTAPASATTAVCRPAVPCGHPTSLGVASRSSITW